MIDRSALLSLFFTIAIGTQAMDRAQADSLIAQAGRAYSSGDHALALRSYDSVLTEYASAGLHYNIANCHFKMQDIPRAILHYERALKLAPGDDDIKANLELARQQIVDRVNEMPRSSFTSTLGRFFGASDADQWAWYAIGAWLITIALLIAAWSTARPLLRRSLLLIGAIGFIVTIAALAFAAAAHGHLKDDSEAILMEPVVEVRSEPGSSATTLFVIHKGIKLNVLQEMDDWAEIGLLNGNVGWIPKNTFERI